MRGATIVEPFQRLLSPGGKLLKQLNPKATSFHRAKATVLMRAFARLCSAPVRPFVAPGSHPLPQNLASILLLRAVWNDANGNR